MNLFHRKSLVDLRRDADNSPLRRTLGVVDLTALGIGSIIGTGIFVLTGTAASQHAGPALILSMIFAATACALAGLCYAEFAAMIPVAGSAYTYTFATIGEFAAWIIGWDLIIEYALSAPTIAVGWSGYFVSFLGSVGIRFPVQFATAPGTTTMIDGTPIHGVFNLPASVIVLVVTALVFRRIKESARTDTWMVVIKMLVLVVFIGAGAAFVQSRNLHPFMPPNTGTFGVFGWSGVLRATGIIFFAYIGFDAVSTASQESRNPQRDMPVAILASLAMCTVLYIGVAIVLMGIVPYAKLNVPDPLAVGIDATGLKWLSPFVKVAALFGLFSTMLVQLIGQTQIFFSMSRDNLLPAMFGDVHPRYRTPYVSTLLTGGVVAIAAGFTPIEVLGQLVSMGTLLAFVLVCVGIIILRRTMPDAPRPFRTPGVPWLPALGAVACLAQMLVLPLATWIRLIVWLATGLVVYFVYGQRRARVAR